MSFDYGGILKKRMLFGAIPLAAIGLVAAALPAQAVNIVSTDCRTDYRVPVGSSITYDLSGCTPGAFEALSGTPNIFGLTAVLDGSGQWTRLSTNSSSLWAYTCDVDTGFDYEGTSYTYINYCGDGTPPDVTQQVGAAPDGTCEITDPTLNWGGAESGNWGKSWGEWLNEGKGGVACTRMLTYDQNLGHWKVLR